MSSTISIPQRECGIESTRSGFHYRIGSITIHTVHIRNLIGLNQCMIETSVEICFFIIRTVYFNTAQIVIPFIMGSSLHSFKIPGRNFCFQILFSPIYTGGRKSHFHHQLVSRLHIERGNNTFAFFCLSHRKINRIDYRTVEFHHKEIILIHPYRIIDMSCQCLGIFPVYFATVDL